MGEKYKILYEDATHKVVMFSFDDETHEESFLSVNQYLLINNTEGCLIDPGSEVIFDELYDAVSELIPLDKIKYIFFSHQDPDVSGSIAQWSISTKAKFIMPAIWTRFMTHYGFTEMSRVLPLRDEGAKLHFGDSFLKFIPAHFLHSPGNFSLYDTQSKTLFSGDIGAAIVSSPQNYKRVENFEEHKTYLEGFHKRYMGSNMACRAWAARVEKLAISTMAPQHGFVFDGDDVGSFIAWFKELQCGSDLFVVTE